MESPCPKDVLRYLKLSYWCLDTFQPIDNDCSNIIYVSGHSGIISSHLLSKCSLAFRLLPTQSVKLKMISFPKTKCNAVVRISEDVRYHDVYELYCDRDEYITQPSPESKTIELEFDSQPSMNENFFIHYKGK